jgi:hypothetical protein
MKLTSLVSVALALITQSHACVHFYGGITDGGLLSVETGINAEVDDNGGVICPGPARIDQDGHYSLDCRRLRYQREPFTCLENAEY